MFSLLVISFIPESEYYFIRFQRVKRQVRMFDMYPESWTYIISATQNVFKYTQTHREIEVLADTSYCFIVYALAIVNNTLLTSSCTLHSRKFLR